VRVVPETTAARGGRRADRGVASPEGAGIAAPGARSRTFIPAFRARSGRTGARPGAGTDPGAGRPASDSSGRPGGAATDLPARRVRKGAQRGPVPHGRSRRAHLGPQPALRGPGRVPQRADTSGGARPSESVGVDPGGAGVRRECRPHVGPRLTGSGLRRLEKRRYSPSPRVQIHAPLFPRRGVLRGCRCDGAVSPPTPRSPA